MDFVRGLTGREGSQGPQMPGATDVAERAAYGRCRPKGHAMFRSDDIRVAHFEVTDKCNAACPMCPRNT